MGCSTVINSKESYREVPKVQNAKMNQVNLG